MKILLINWQDPANPQAGGAEVHLKEVFSRLQDKGHEIEWLVSRWDDAPEEEAFQWGRVHRSGGRYTFGLAAPMRYRRRLAKRGYDVVVEALNKVPVYSPLWSQSPVVLLVHHLFGATAFRQAPLPLAAATWLQERPIASVYRGVTVEAISESTKQDLVRRGLSANQICVNRPGVDASFYRPSASPTRAIPPTFLYLGRLQRYKRVDLILRAFARLHADVSHARLVVAGHGDEEPALRALASELGIDGSVHFAGFVTEIQKRNLMRAAWANVFVSPKEGWGMTNVEAAACGTPSIAAASPGLRESVIDRQTGVLIEADVDSLHGALQEFASNREMVERLGRNALNFSGTFTWSAAAEQTERHLHAAMESTSPTRVQPSEEEEPSIPDEVASGAGLPRNAREP